MKKNQIYYGIVIVETVSLTGIYFAILIYL